MNSYNFYGQPYSQPYWQPTPTNTNKIFVSGIDEVRNKVLMPNSDYIFIQNDGNILYEKIVDTKGQFEIKTVYLSEKAPEIETKEKEQVDFTEYAKTSEIKAIRQEIESLKEKLGKVAVVPEVVNGDIRK